MLCNGIQGYWIVSDLFLHVGPFILRFIPVYQLLIEDRVVTNQHNDAEELRRLQGLPSWLSIRAKEFEVNLTLSNEIEMTRRWV